MFAKLSAPPAPSPTCHELESSPGTSLFKTRELLWPVVLVVCLCPSLLSSAPGTWSGAKLTFYQCVLVRGG